MSSIFDQIELPENISEEKINFLKYAIENSKNIQNNELIPYFTKLIREANRLHIQFQDEEISQIISNIKNQANEEDNNRINQLLNLSKS